MLLVIIKRLFIGINIVKYQIIILLINIKFEIIKFKITMIKFKLNVFKITTFIKKNSITIKMWEIDFIFFLVVLFELIYKISLVFLFWTFALYLGFFVLGFMPLLSPCYFFYFIYPLVSIVPFSIEYTIFIFFLFVILICSFILFLPLSLLFWGFSGFLALSFQQAVHSSSSSFLLL